MERRGSVIVPSSSLLPENDPTTLFTGSGMQPMIPYLLGEPHPSGKDIVNVQKCLRTGDIDETGDSSHLTFFEMTGRWEFGADPSQYKRTQIEAIWQWQVGELGLAADRLYVTVYQGNKEFGIERDDEAIAIWCDLFREVGIEPTIEDEPWKYGASRGGRIFVYNEKENWWSRSGVPANMPVGEPGGPDSEMFFDFNPDGDPSEHPADSASRFLEIGNNVFMSYQKTDTGFVPLEKPNIDYGGGLERLAAAVNGDPDTYLTTFFKNPLAELSNITGRGYSENQRAFRIILDHTRAATFLIGDGAPPANSDAGYITRRLVRRAIRVARSLGVEEPFLTKLSAIYIEEASAYPQLAHSAANILSVLEKEEEQFQKTLHSGEREMKKHLEQKGQVSGKDAFYFYETFGFPRELTEEFLAEHGAALVAPEGFDEAAKAHAEKSRTAAEGKFKGGLADHSEKTTALHSTCHLMLAGLRLVLGDHVHQKGSNITAERIRFDFSHPDKMTPEEIKAVEDYVNEAIDSQSTVTMLTMPKEEAQSSGVEGSFWEKYPETVKVYVFEDGSKKLWSKELCGGPHVESTTDIQQYGRFKIKKEQSSSAGVRRVKAVLSA